MKTMLGEVDQKLKAAGYDVYYTYTRNENVPVACHAYVYRSDSYEGRPDAVGEAKCHPKDNFWKKKGRHMAVCRAAKQLGVI